MSTPESDPAHPGPRPQALAESLPDDDDILAGGQGTVIVEPSMAQQRLPSRAPVSAHARQMPEVEAALRQAHLLRARGDAAGAEREVRQAIAHDSASSAAYEMLGDLQLQAGQTPQAGESYRRAQSCGAGAAIESKIARATLQSSRRETDMLREVPLTRGRAWLGYVASALIPGLGVALAGEYSRAAVAFVGWAVTLGLMLGIPSVRAVIESAMGPGHGAAPAAGGGQFLFLFLGLANVGFWIYSLIDTGRVANGDSGAARKVN